MPTSHKVKSHLFDHLPKPKGTIIDLGSGWGTLLFPLATTFPKNPIIGYETSPIPYLFSKLRLKITHRPNLSFLREDFFSAPLEEATTILCYLYPKAMEKLESKFEEELTKGTWVISHTFALPHWKPVKVVEADDLYKTKIYLYQKD